MERLALIGVSHRRGGADALERYQAHFDADALERLETGGYPAFVPLVTCNRWDLVLHLPDAAGAADALAKARTRLTPPGQRRPYAYAGDAALEQLARIAASLDSLNPGEDQIMRQVREAYLAARDRGRTDSTLAFAFETALRIAKRVRREVALAPMHTSLFSLARPDLEAALGPGDAVAVLGAGEMGALAAKALADLDGLRLIVANRSEPRARQLARPLGAEAWSLETFRERPPALAALVCATPVARLVDRALLAKLPGLRLVVDLGVPRNVEREAAFERGLHVLDVDALQTAGNARREVLAENLAQAEGLIRDELDAAVEAWAERQLGPSIRRLREAYLASIGDAVPDDLARRLAHRFARLPIKGLRAVARDHGLAAARTFLDETGLGDDAKEGGDA